MGRKRPWRRPTAARVALFPTLAEQDTAVGVHQQGLNSGEQAYFAARAIEHRRLGYESAEHRAANAHHLLASLYEALAGQERGE